MRRFLGSILTVEIVIVLASNSGCGKTPEVVPFLTPPSQAEATLQLASFVSKVLDASNQAGSLVYEGKCAPGEINDPFKLTTPTHMTPALDALREGFAQDPQLSASLESGLIRVTGGNVPRDLLNLRIERVSFRNEDDPRDAVQKILTLPDVRSYMDHHGIQFLTVQEGIYAPPTKGSPNLNVTLQDVTLSDALDRIVRTFPGVWIYRECVNDGGHRAVYIGVQQFSLRPTSP